jgi:hypothetical protein
LRGEGSGEPCDEIDDGLGGLMRIERAGRRRLLDDARVWKSEEGAALGVGGEVGV